MGIPKISIDLIESLVDILHSKNCTKFMIEKREDLLQTNPDLIYLIESIADKIANIESSNLNPTFIKTQFVFQSIFLVNLINSQIEANELKDMFE